MSLHTLTGKHANPHSLNVETNSGARQRSRHHCKGGTSEQKDHVSPRRAAEYFIPPEANLGSFYTQAKILRHINYAAAVRNIKAPLNWGDLCGGSSSDDFPYFFPFFFFLEAGGERHTRLCD